MSNERIISKSKFFESAIMICIAKINGKDCFILEKRAENIRQAGEISFPGGKKDLLDKTFRQTAIRETIEELRIKRKQISNIEKFGIMFAGIGAFIECYICQLNITNIEDIDYNKNEVQKLLAVPIEFFINNKPIIENIEIWNKARFDVKKYNFTKKYINNWKLPDRKIYIYMYENEAIWGITAEIIFEFIEILKEKGNVCKYEYR